MTKDEVILRLCVLVSEVGRKKFDDQFAHDCFCGENPFGEMTMFGKSTFNVEEPVIEFIELAVRKELEK